MPTTQRLRWEYLFARDSLLTLLDLELMSQDYSDAASVG
jgi:hypothetical protein